MADIDLSIDKEKEVMKFRLDGQEYVGGEAPKFLKVFTDLVDSGLAKPDVDLSKTDGSRSDPSDDTKSSQ